MTDLEKIYDTCTNIDSKMLTLFKDAKTIVDLKKVVNKLEFDLYSQDNSLAKNIELQGKIAIVNGKINEMNNSSSVSLYEQALISYNRLQKIIPLVNKGGGKAKVAFVEQVQKEIHVLLGNLNEVVYSQKEIDNLAHMPGGIEEKLKGWKGGAFDMWWSCGFHGRTGIVTEDYNVAASRYWSSEYSDASGYSQSEGDIHLFFSKKGNKEIYVVSTPSLITSTTSKHKHYDKKLAKYNSVGFEVLDKNEISVWWENDQKEQGPTYTFNLDSEFELKLEDLKKNKD